MSISAAKIARMRAQVEARSLTDLCTIYTQTDASVGGGNRSKTPSVLASSVPICLYALSLGTEDERAGQVKAVRKMGAQIPATQSVTEKNTITITSLSNRRFQITKVIKTSNNITTRLELEEIG